LFRLSVVVILGLMATGCVTKTSYDELQAQHDDLSGKRDDLAAQVERLEIERNSYEQEFLNAQESFEDERVTRTTLAENLARIEKQATQLDRDLEAERIARMTAAEALALREAEIAAMQGTYDELVSDLESEVSSGQIEIERLREGLRLNVSDDVLFASGSARLDKIGRDVLVKVAARLKELNDFVEVRGHTDDRKIRGDLAKIYPSNWELAAARAARVVRLLEEQGVPGDQLAVVSLGPNDPVASNDTPEDRARNRRIEIRLEPRPPAPASTEAEN
jgi:chemotaxis protein MotB